TRLAAVLVLLFEQDGQLRVLLTTRAKELRTHGGQTSLPGGKMEDADGDIVVTACREANEEVSLPLDSPHVHILGTLELNPFHALIVTPVVALLTDNSILDVLRAGKGEVDHIFSHPLEAILEPNLAPSLETLVAHGSEYWPYESKHHHHVDYVVKALGGMTYRLHCYQTSASPITGMTADILIRAAEIAYHKQPQFERYAFDQLRTYEAIVKAYEANRVAYGPK
ncbi:NUDIX hydrolase domain-like protein, partial [Flammula alnicola]